MHVHDDSPLYMHAFAFPKPLLTTAPFWLWFGSVNFHTPLDQQIQITRGFHRIGQSFRTSRIVQWTKNGKIMQYTMCVKVVAQLHRRLKVFGFFFLHSSGL